MSASVTREKCMVALFFTTFFAGWAWSATSPILGTAILCGSMILAALTPDRISPTWKTDVFQSMFLTYPIVIVIIWGTWSKQRELDAMGRFNSYLSQNECALSSEDVTGFTSGGCDGFGNCEEGEEVVEPEYECEATDTTITLSKFRAGVH